MKTPLILTIVMLVALVFSLTFVPMINFGIIVYYANRTEGDIVASGWAAYSKYDLTTFAARENIGDREGRRIWLDKPQAEDTVRSEIMKNMGLDASLVPQSDSYLVKNGMAASLDVTVINPDELPYALPDGRILNETAIHIVAQLPVEQKAPYYRTKDIYVLADTFLISRQH